jgi:hypothetical protein
MKKIILYLSIILIVSCVKDYNNNPVDIKSKIEGVWIETYPNDYGSTIYIGKDTIVGITNDAYKDEIFKARHYKLQNNNSILYSDFEMSWKENNFMDYYTEIIFYKPDSVRIKKFVRSDSDFPRDFKDIVIKKIK